MGDLTVTHFVQQVLHRPGELTDLRGTYHASTAFQGMKSTSHFGQRVGVFGVVAPQRQLNSNGLEHLLGLVDEDLQQLGVDLPADGGLGSGRR